MNMRKLQAAVHQLDTAIELFLRGDHLSSLTLAGAAEEILGALSARAGLPVAIEHIAAFHRPDTDCTLTDAQSEKVIRSVANKARNSSKHANDPDEDEVDVELIHPLQMIMRAMPMRKGFGLEESVWTARMLEWIRAHPEATK